MVVDHYKESPRIELTNFIHDLGSLASVVEPSLKGSPCFLSEVSFAGWEDHLRQSSFFFATEGSLCDDVAVLSSR